MWSARFWTPRHFDSRFWSATGFTDTPADLDGVAVIVGGIEMKEVAGIRMLALAGLRMKLVGG